MGSSGLEGRGAEARTPGFYPRSGRGVGSNGLVGWGILGARMPGFFPNWGRGVGSNRLGRMGAGTRMPGFSYVLGGE